MHFDRRFVLVLAASLCWGLLVAAVFYRVAGGRKAAVHLEPQKTLVVATHALPIAATIDREAVHLKQVPESQFPAGGLTRIEDVVDRPVVSAILEGEPVMEARLAIKGSGMGLAPMIPSGMRAIAVRVNDVVGVAGFVLPGMRVDVLVTGRPPNRNDTLTRTVLQNVTVLSAGQTIQADGKSQSINTPVVTLLVSPQQAEALTLANTDGHIQLVLRNSADSQIAATHGQELHELYGSPADAVPEPAAAPRPARTVTNRAAARPAVLPPLIVPVVLPAPDQVEMIRGGVRKIELFQPSGTGSK